MKMVKSLLLGSAAGLVAMAGAQAADLPVKAKAVQYVKICSLYGAGFYYMPGTDICLKIGGWVRQEIAYGYNGSMTTEWFNNNLNNRSTHNNVWRTKGVLSADARQQTAYGTLRSYLTVGTSNNNVGDNPAGLYANRWFIQFAGFTMGKSTSFFDFYSIGANQYGVVSGSSDSGDGGWEVFGYTAQFGNGMSMSLSAEVQRRTRNMNVNLSTAILGSNALSGNYQGHNYPDFVANWRVDQAWGSAQVMGALHYVGGLYYGATEITGNPGNEMGYALGAGLKLKTPMIGPGDYFEIQGTYTKGASRYSNMTATIWDYSKYDGASFGWGYNTDAVYGGAIAAGNASGLELTTTWAVNAAFTHYWTPALKSTLWGSYMSVEYGGLANGMICSALGAGAGAGTTAVAAAGCDMDWQLWGLGLRTEWSPVKELGLGIEVLYANLESATLPGGLVALGANGTKPAGVYVIDNQDQWAIRGRATRYFLP